jgi:hypothetical protein
VKTWLVDIDGTLALRGARGPFDWHRVGEDAPNEPVLDVVRALARNGHQIIFISGRKEQCRRETVAWLRLHGLDATRLYLRADSDNRPDQVLKREIYDKHILGRHDVAGVIDDRDRVVRVWRSLGLTCLQVAEGKF